MTDRYAFKLHPARDFAHPGPQAALERHFDEIKLVRFSTTHGRFPPWTISIGFRWIKSMRRCENHQLCPLCKNKAMG